jgi:hypothetical protein
MKSLFTLSLLLSTIALLAQPVSKKGEPYLPAEGDWAISIDAAPFLEYFGNFFSQAENSAPSANFPNSNFAIAAKKFKTDNFAYRASARVNIFNDATKAFVPEFSVDPTNTTVEDKYSRTFTNLYLSLGIEKRKGSTRVQGFYGAEAVLGFGTENHKFEYGNDITQENTNPDRAEFEILFQDDPRELTNITEQGGFITEFRKGTSFSLGARGFIGAEVFIFPKFSLGAEFGLSAGFFFEGNGQITSEQWTVPVGGNTEQFVTTITDEGGGSTFRLDNDNSGGAIFMNFYF